MSIKIYIPVITELNSATLGPVYRSKREAVGWLVETLRTKDLGVEEPIEIGDSYNTLLKKLGTDPCYQENYNVFVEMRYL